MMPLDRSATLARYRFHWAEPLFWIGAILFLTPGAMAWLPASPSLVRVGPAGYRDPALAAGTSVSKLDGPTTTEADDASRLDRMDDDGGWQMTQFPG